MRKHTLHSWLFSTDRTECTVNQAYDATHSVTWTLEALGGRVHVRLQDCHAMTSTTRVRGRQGKLFTSERIRPRLHYWAERLYCVLEGRYQAKLDAMYNDPNYEPDPMGRLCDYE